MNTTTSTETVWGLAKRGRMYVELTGDGVKTTPLKFIGGRADFYTFCEKQRAIWHQQEYGYGESTRLKGFKPIAVEITRTTTVRFEA